MTAVRKMKLPDGLRMARFVIDGWSASKGCEYKNLERTERSSFLAMREAIIRNNSWLSPTQLTIALGFQPHSTNVARFRVHWRDFYTKELARLEADKTLSHDQILYGVQKLFVPSSKWMADTKLRTWKLKWICEHIVHHTNLDLTHTNINLIGYKKRDRDPQFRDACRELKKYRNELVLPILGQLEQIPPKEIVDSPSERAIQLLNLLRRVWTPRHLVDASSILDSLVRSICDYIVSSRRIVPTYKYLKKILPFIPPFSSADGGLKQLLKSWRRKKGIPDRVRGNMDPTVPRTWETLAPTLAKCVSTAPLTFLDPRAPVGRYVKLDDEIAEVLGRCQNLKIRSCLALATLAGCGNRDSLPGFAKRLLSIIEAASLNGPADPRMEEALRSFVNGDLLLQSDASDNGDDEDGDDESADDAWSRNQIKDFFRVYRCIVFAQSRYLGELSKHLQDRFSDVLLRPLVDQVFWKAARFEYKVIDVRQRARKSKTDALFPHFGKIRTIPEFRFNQANRIRIAFDEASVNVRSGKASLPHDFSVNENEPILGAPAIHRFRLWSRFLIGRDQSRPHPRARKDHRLESNLNEDLFVEYLGATNLDGFHSNNELWFADLIRFNAVMKGEDLRDDKTAALMKSYGISDEQYVRIWPTLCHSRQLSSSLLSHLRVLRKSSPNYRPVYFHPHGLYTVCLVGRAANRIFSVTGCRINELQQINASPKCLVQINLEHRSPAFAFLAIPKLRREPEPYFVDDRCVLFLRELVEWISKHSKVNAVPSIRGAKTLALHKRKEMHPYIFQSLGKNPTALAQMYISSYVRFVLHGMQFTTLNGQTFQPGMHDFRHLTATTLRSQGVPIDVIAKMLKQRDVSVTSYYSEPTSSQVVTAMQGLQMAVIGIGTPSAIRTPEELTRQLKEADGQVGALTKVLGGTCTVAAKCSVKFACIGCAGLVPDHREMPAMIRNQERLKQDLDYYVASGNMAEVRKCESSLADIERVVNEMELQKRAEADSLKL